MSQTLSANDARLIALAAQGFDTPRPASVGEAEIEATARQLALIQLDSVNVVVRSHYMPFFARLGSYDRSLVERVAFDQRKMYEYWAHVASLIPMETYPLLRWRMEASPPRWRIKGLLEEAPGYVDAILDEVGKRGPMIASDLDDPGSRKGPWWGYSEGKIALEWHFLKGEITTHSRRNFTRYYDLTERVIPADILSQNSIGANEAQKQLFLLGAKAHGIGTAKDLTDYFRLHHVTMRPRISELVEDGRVLKVDVEGWDEPGYLHPDAAIPDEVHATALLTPFDSLVWRRERTERMFGFHYRIEIYVPEPKRKYGYYVMPFMMDGELVARVDLKADRQKGVLRAQSAFIEPGRPEGRVAAALAAELKLMASWLELDRVVVGRKGDLVSALRTEIKNGKGK